MRIAFNTLIENPRMPSGSTDFYMQITRELARQDKRNEYYLFVSPANRHLYQIESANVHLINCFVSNERPLVRIISSQFVVPYRLAQHKIDVLFSPQNISAFYIPKSVRNIIAIIATHHWKVPNKIGQTRALYRRLISNVACRQADIILANSLTTRQDILENMPVAPDKVRVIYEGLDHRRFFPGVLSDEVRDLARMGVQRPFILFASTLWRYKNVHTLLEGFGKLCQKTTLPHALVMVGRTEKIEGGKSGYGGCLLEICDRFGIRGRVKFMGYVSSKDVPKFFRAADLYVQPSLHETFGKTVTEAFACGTPVIASDISVMPEVVGEAGLLFDPYDSEHLMEVMSGVLLDPQLRSVLIQRGLERAKLFSFARQARELIALFEELGGPTRVCGSFSSA